MDYKDQNLRIIKTFKNYENEIFICKLKDNNIIINILI